jgi:hypothetical protein
MSEERGRSQSVFFWLFCLVAGTVFVFVVVLGSVYIENEALGTHRIEEACNGWHIDAPFRWVIRVTRIWR